MSFGGYVSMHDWVKGDLYPEATKCRACGVVRVKDVSGRTFYVHRRKGINTRSRPRCVSERK